MYSTVSVKIVLGHANRRELKLSEEFKRIKEVSCSYMKKGDLQRWIMKRPTENLLPPVEEIVVIQFLIRWQDLDELNLTDKAV